MSGWWGSTRRTGSRSCGRRWSAWASCAAAVRRDCDLLGVSFSSRRAAHAGLEWRRALQELLTLDLDPIRLSANWEAIDRDGYGDLDWELDEVGRAGRSVLLTAGMKAIGWPEFFIPGRLTPPAPSWGEVGRSSPALGSAVLDFLSETVERYRSHPALLAWQLENEPLNRSGPRSWWIGPELLERELSVIRRLDPERQLLLTAFGHVNWVVDLLSNPRGQGPSRLLELLPERGTLGLDVYIRVEQRLGPLHWIWRSDRAWRSEAARWRRQAELSGRQAWVTEAQAEPWGPRSFQPADIRTVVEGVREAGYERVLLWGAEHWLSRAALGDRSWLDAVAALPRAP